MYFDNEMTVFVGLVLLRLHCRLLSCLPPLLPPQDLTQSVWGFSRDDAIKFIGRYSEQVYCDTRYAIGRLHAPAHLPVCACVLVFMFVCV